MKCSSEDSLGRSLGRDILIAHDGNEQVGNAGCAHLAERVELVAIDAIEQQDAATEQLALVKWFERVRRGDVVGMNHHFQIARLDFFHAAIKYDAAAIDEHEVGENVLHLFDLMRGYDDGALAVEIIVEQRIVKLFAIEDVQA